MYQIPCGRAGKSYAVGTPHHHGTLVDDEFMWYAITNIKIIQKGIHPFFRLCH